MTEHTTKRTTSGWLTKDALREGYKEERSTKYEFGFVTLEHILGLDEPFAVIRYERISSTASMVVEMKRFYSLTDARKHFTQEAKHE